MSKRLSIMGALCTGLIALWVSGAHAITLSMFSFSRLNPIVVDLSWGGIGNADKTLTWFEVVLTPNTDVADYPFLVYWKNPGEKTGGEATNFEDGTITPISDGSLINPFITGKGKAQSQTIFGSCDDCTDKNLPEDGKLWFLFDYDNACGSQDPEPELSPEELHDYYLGIINCIKLDLAEREAPSGNGWWPIYVQIDNLNVDIKAYRDGDLAVTGDFDNCKINSENVYICDSAVINNNP